MKPVLLRTATALAALAAAALGAPAAVANPQPEPVPGYNAMGTPPPGTNDWNCKPSATHPRPVVLVHGTASSMQSAFSVLGPQLKDQGYCSFALNYGGVPTWYNPSQTLWGLSDIRQSGVQLAGFVDAVLAHTGATQVDIVGHSQGGTVARQYLKFDGGADPSDPARNKVHSVVALGPTTHGTTFNGEQQLYAALAQLGLNADQISTFAFGVAGRQQLVGSKLLADLNAGGETLPGIDYTVIASKYDDVVTPPRNSFLAPGPNVHNVWVQDGCEKNTVQHSNLLGDERSRYLVMSALDAGYADGKQAPC